MKKLVIIVFLMSMSIQGQTFKKLIKEYEKDCNSIVQDTIRQYGEVKYTHIPVHDKSGDIIHYVIKAMDTVWVKPNCPEYKIVSHLFMQRSNLSMMWTSNTTLTGGAVLGSTIENPTIIKVERDYICDCKKREVEPFSNHFWNWIKNKK